MIRVFEIPVYRISPQKNDEEYGKKLLWAENIASRLYDNPKEVKEFSIAVSSRGEFSWEFNEIIGYIILEAGNHSIHAELSLISGAIRKNTAKKIGFHTPTLFSFYM